MNVPEHYKMDPQPIDVIQDWGNDFNLGNAIKYIARAGRKGSRKEDLTKALDYLEDALKRIAWDDKTGVIYRKEKYPAYKVAEEWSLGFNLGRALIAIHGASSYTGKERKEWLESACHTLRREIEAC